MFHKGIDDIGHLDGALCDYFFYFIMTKGWYFLEKIKIKMIIILDNRL